MRKWSPSPHAMPISSSYGGEYFFEIYFLGSFCLITTYMNFMITEQLLTVCAAQ